MISGKNIRCMYWFLEFLFLVEMILSGKLVLNVIGDNVFIPISLYSMAVVWLVTYIISA